MCSLREMVGKEGGVAVHPPGVTGFSAANGHRRSPAIFGVAGAIHGSKPLIVVVELSPQQVADSVDSGPPLIAPTTEDGATRACDPQKDQEFFGHSCHVQTPKHHRKDCSPKCRDRKSVV